MCGETSEVNIFCVTLVVYLEKVQEYESNFENLVETIIQRFSQRDYRVLSSNSPFSFELASNCLRKSAFLSFRAIGPPRCFLLQQFATATVRGFSRVTHFARACTCDHGACACAFSGLNGPCRYAVASKMTLLVDSGMRPRALRTQRGANTLYPPGGERFIVSESQEIFFALHPLVLQNFSDMRGKQRLVYKICKLSIS